MTDNDDVVRITWRSKNTVTAAVRDSAGIHSCIWTLDGGWVCSSCTEEIGCCHILAARTATAETVAP